MTKILRESRNEEELRHVWTEWHDKCGTPIKEKFVRFVELGNKAAKLNGTLENVIYYKSTVCDIVPCIYSDFPDIGAYWLHEYESDTFKDDVEDLWNTVKPLYKELHAYVRSKLRDVYADQFSDDGLIPAHLLGINKYKNKFNNLNSKTYNLIRNN